MKFLAMPGASPERPRDSAAPSTCVADTGRKALRSYDCGKIGRGFGAVTCHLTGASLPRGSGEQPFPFRPLTVTAPPSHNHESICPVSSHIEARHEDR